MAGQGGVGAKIWQKHRISVYIMRKITLRRGGEVRTQTEKIGAQAQQVVEIQRQDKDATKILRRHLHGYNHR